MCKFMLRKLPLCAYSKVKLHLLDSISIIMIVAFFVITINFDESYVNIINSIFSSYYIGCYCNYIFYIAYQEANCMYLTPPLTHIPPFSIYITSSFLRSLKFHTLTD